MYLCVCNDVTKDQIINDIKKGLSEKDSNISSDLKSEAICDAKEVFPEPIFPSIAIKL